MKDFGVVVCDVDECWNAVLHLFVRHDTNSLSSISLVPIICDLVVVRDLCVEHRLCVVDSFVDSVVCVE